MGQLIINYRESAAEERSSDKTPTLYDSCPDQKIDNAYIQSNLEKSIDEVETSIKQRALGSSSA